MELFNYLTDEDKITIKEFIQAYANIDNVDLYKALGYWNKNKKKMFKALGRKLRVKIPVDIQCDDKLFLTTLQEIYTPPFGWKIEGKTNHPFIVDFENFAQEKSLNNKNSFTQQTIREQLAQMFRYDNFKSGVLNRDYSFVREEKRLKIPEGTKIMKAIRKMLVFAGYSNMDLFESFRNEISNLTTSKHVKTNLVFSIHPIDFLTMSDNSLGWHSCMSWMQRGGYSTGPIEMMNSNMVIMAYLESKKSFMFNMHDIPNKSWRILLYIHKNILLAGKSYPYYNEKITLKVLDTMREILYNNMGWKYQYINQEYRDLRGYHANDFLRFSVVIRRKSSNQHKIIIYTNGMYNDLVEAQDYTYWCCRNWVPKVLTINASGIANCMVCGKPIETQELINFSYDGDLEVHGTAKVCNNCHDCLCNNCDSYITSSEQYQIKVWQWYRPWNQGKIKTRERYKNVCRNCITEYFYTYDDNNQIIFIHQDNVFKYKEICCDSNPKLYRVGGNIERFFASKDSCVDTV